MYLFSPPGNMRKPKGFLCFLGVEEGCIGNKRVNEETLMKKTEVRWFDNFDLKQLSKFFEV